jgi:AraC-like DNA-binding protein
MLYREHRPAAALRPYVACYWTLRGSAPGDAGHRVLPDGCMDILFDLGAQPGARVVGAMTRAIVTAPKPAGEWIDLLGVRFRPGEGPSLLGVAAREVRDQALALRDVCGGWGQTLADRLYDGRAQPGALLGCLDDALLARGRRFAPDRRLRRALLELEQGAREVGGVARSIGLGQRHLLRLFDEHVGLGPRAFARVVRGQALVASMDAIPPSVAPAWARLAAEHGFADQAHMVREVRSLAGVSPAALLRERAGGRLGVSETFNPPATALATVGA